MVTVPLLAAAVGLLVFRAPELFGSAREGILRGTDTLAGALSRGDPALAALALIQLVVLALVPLGSMLAPVALLRHARRSPPTQSAITDLGAAGLHPPRAIWDVRAIGLPTLPARRRRSYHLSLLGWVALVVVLALAGNRDRGEGTSARWRTFRLRSVRALATIVAR